MSHALRSGVPQEREANNHTQDDPLGVEAFRDNNTAAALGCISRKRQHRHRAQLRELEPAAQAEQGPILAPPATDCPPAKPACSSSKKTPPSIAWSSSAIPMPTIGSSSPRRASSPPTNGKLHPGKTRTNPRWVHSIDLAVRKGGVKEWEGRRQVRRRSLSRRHTSNLIYVTQHGFIAIIPEEKEVTGEGKAPNGSMALDLSCRKHDEKSFTRTPVSSASKSTTTSRPAT